jgi:hypothetical protein
MSTKEDEMVTERIEGIGHVERAEVAPTEGGAGAMPRARHASDAVSSPGRLVWRVVRTGRVHYPLLLLSDQARGILANKYDAFVTDRAYDLEPSGRLGPVGRAVDARVLRFPVHEALRQRLEMVVDALVTAIGEASGQADPVRVLSAPCGLARDVGVAAGRIGRRSRSIHVAWTGVDIDERGTVLAEARRRAAGAGVPIDLFREDLLAPGSNLDARCDHDGPFQVVNCIGLASWLDLPDIERLARRFAALSSPGATLLIDTFRRHEHSHLGRCLEIPTRYHADEDVEASLRAGGWQPEDPRISENGVATLWVARRSS